VGEGNARRLVENRLPISAASAKAMGFIDDCFGDNSGEFREQVRHLAEQIACDRSYASLLEAKRQRRAADERRKPLHEYREEEMA
jgi:putative two-component system hydrogenase maturation factor HypX/HoxX